MNIGELFIALGFDVDDKKLKEFKDEVKDGVEGLLKMSAVAAGALYAVNAFVAGSIQSATAMRNFHLQTNLSVDSLQRWQIAARMANTAMTNEQVTSTIQALQNSISDVTQGRGPSGQFSRLGINVIGKDAFQVLEEMRANFQANVQKWGYVQTVNLMKETGIDPALINAILLTRSAFDKLADNKLLSPEYQQRLVALGTAFTDLSQRWSLFQGQLAADWAPSIIQGIDKVLPYLKDFSESLMAVGKAIGIFYNSLSPEMKAGIIAFAVALYVAYAPLTATFVALAAAIWDVGRALRGLPSEGGWLLLKILNLMHSEDGSPIAELKKKLSAAGNGTAENIFPQGQGDARASAVPEEFWKSTLYHPSQELQRASAFNYNNLQKMMSQIVNQTNNFEINSTADPAAIANQVASFVQRERNHAFDLIDYGPGW